MERDGSIKCRKNDLDCNLHLLIDLVCCMLQVCPGHTWQSLKSRYIKVILPKINTYDDIPQHQRNKLQESQGCDLSKSFSY